MKRTYFTTLIVSLLLVLSLILGAGCNLLSDLSPAPPAAPPDTTNITPTDAGETQPPVTEKSTIGGELPAPPPAGQAAPLPSIADAVARVKPAVVAVNTELQLLDFFNRPFTQKGAGSGWIIREDGLIITNNHVVENARAISVTLDDGRTFAVDVATVVTDRLTDLAVLKINATNLPVAPVGDSSRMRIGDWVVAIGNALGEGIRATQGIVSRRDATIEAEQAQILYGLIETDAAINPGNSGGPLVNMSGEVIGITSAKLSAVGIEATGFAISTETAMPVIQQLITTGKVVHPWLGVSLSPIDQVIVRQFGLAVDKGALIVEVVVGSPAGAAGLQPRDVIVSFGGKKIDTVNGAIQAIRTARVGQSIEIVYWRGSSERTASATLVERPAR